MGLGEKFEKRAKVTDDRTKEQKAWFLLFYTLKQGSRIWTPAATKNLGDDRYVQGYNYHIRIVDDAFINYIAGKCSLEKYKASLEKYYLYIKKVLVVTNNDLSPQGNAQDNAGQAGEVKVDIIPKRGKLC